MKTQTKLCTNCGESHADNVCCDVRAAVNYKPQPQDKATARPWRVSTANDYSGIVIETNRKWVDDRETICTMEWDEQQASFGTARTTFNDDVHDETKANAALIVKAVNQYDALVAVAEAAKEVRQHLGATVRMGTKAEQDYKNLCNALIMLEPEKYGAAVRGESGVKL